MPKLEENRMDDIARNVFIEKLDAAFLRDVPRFAELSKEDRKAIFKEVIRTTEEKGIKSEQGIASYALALLWLGPDFEAKSKELQALLDSDYPEVGKVHAMNEWVNEAIGNPDNIAAADEKLRHALKLTEAWGK